MATINIEIYEKFKKAMKMSMRQEGDGHEIDFDVREDEEQSVKQNEIINLLVSAGYFRARIIGLSAFDKIVGGMVWCIDSCSIDVNVDLLFQENSTIGQKIALTEKIVAVLPEMKCPHRIEPHQIQGLDFIHIYPVIQWLVKRSMEYRKERSEFVRSYAVNQYNKEFGNDLKQSDNQIVLIKNLTLIEDFYSPQRCLKRKSNTNHDILTKINGTLLEYEYKDEKNMKSDKTNNMETLLINLNLNNTISNESDNQESIKNLNKHLNNLQMEFNNKITKEEIELTQLEEQNNLILTRIKKLEEENEKNIEAIKNLTSELDGLKLKKQNVEKQLKEFEEIEENDPEVINEIEQLVILNENLRCQETQFKEQCKKELERLNNLIDETKKIQPNDDNIEIKNKLKDENEILSLVRLKLARKNRSVSILQRQLDNIPNRPELTQYQRRFLELYNQVAAKHKETKQYYTLYNTLEDTRQYMKKELSLLNSISDNYPEAMQSNAGKEEFLTQFQQIVDGVRQSKLKFEKKLLEEKRRRDQLSGNLQILIEYQRKYVSVVRQLTIECKRYEALLTKKS